jgi:branched-chain amino acid transport system substrate-binding protein
VASVTGELAFVGQNYLHAMNLAVDEINAAGGVLGQKLTIENADDKTDKDLAFAAAENLAAKKVPIIFGAVFSGASLRVAEVTVPNRIVQISGSATSPALSAVADDGYLNRTCPSDALQGRILAQRARTTYGFQKVAVVHVPGAYGAGLASEFATAFTAAGGTITSVKEYVEKQSSYATLLTDVYQDEPEAVLLVAYAVDGAQIVKDYNLSFSSKGTFWFFADGVDDAAFRQAVGTSGFSFQHEGSFPSAPAGSPAFKAAFMSTYGVEPDGYAQNYYDAVYLAAAAMVAAGASDGPSIQGKLAQVAGPPGMHVSAQDWKTALELLESGADIDWDGASGPVDLDAHGDVAGLYDIWKVQAGARVVLESGLSP